MLKESLSTYHHAEISSSNFVLQQRLATSGLIGDFGGWYLDGEAYLNKGPNFKKPPTKTMEDSEFKPAKKLITFYQNSQGLTVFLKLLKIIEGIQNSFPLWYWTWSGNFPDPVRKLENKNPCNILLEGHVRSFPQFVTFVPLRVLGSSHKIFGQPAPGFPWGDCQSCWTSRGKTGSWVKKTTGELLANGWLTWVLNPRGSMGLVYLSTFSCFLW